MTLRRELPSGTVTFLFTDIEGSTRLLQEIGGESYAEELMRHRELVREVLATHRGFELGTEGDAFFVVFARASDALAAAEAVQAALARGRVRVRMGIHTGEPLVANGGYIGLDVHKAARICAAGHGGQVLVSQATREVAGAELRDLGEHRLKDLTAAERLFQLGDEDFPPLKTLKRANLPVQPTPLFGRHDELAELVSLAGAHRLLTLTGPGGTGKTRLALEVAAGLADDYPNGVWWVPLAAVSDPALVLPTIAQAVGARDGLVEHLADRRLLLLLDNLEQVLEAGPLIGELLGAAPGLTVVATSRERIALSGEQEYPVPPLADSAATELFVSRARQLKPEFEPDEAVIDICRRLDRLPLALELAATRVKLLTTNQILARLERRLDVLSGGTRDLPGRQATMRAAIDWSYDLLSEPEQRCFRGLAVFAGSFELEAAEAVCRASLDTLSSLVDKSLLRQTENGHLFLLETTREYAHERLERAGETAELRRRHAEWFLEFVRSADDDLLSPQQGLWLERLRADNDNLRAALNWTLEEDVARGVGLATTLFLPWQGWGQARELLAWFGRALANPELLDTDTRAQGLSMYGRMLLDNDEHERAEQVLNQSLALFRERGDEKGEAFVLNWLGSVYWARGSHEQAIAFREAALAISRRADDHRGIANSLHLLGDDLRDMGDLARATAMFEEAIAIRTRIGDRRMTSYSLHSLGDAALDARDLHQAAGRYRAALKICVELGEERIQVYCLAGLACVAALRGNAGSAGRLWTIAEADENRLGLRILSVERARYERNLAPFEHDPAFRAGIAAAHGVSLKQAVQELFSVDTPMENQQHHQ